MKTSKNRLEILMPALLLSLVAAGFTGCANDAGRSMDGATTSDANSVYNNPYQANGTISENGYDCPSAADVVPNQNSSAIFTDRWTVCTNTENTADIELQGQATESEVCIFPAEIVNSSEVITFAYDESSSSGSSSPLPWYQCVSPTSTGAYAAFAGINYNAIFVVEFSNVDAMQACLYSGTYYNCPPYSYGKIR